MIYWYSLSFKLISHVFTLCFKLVASIIFISIGVIASFFCAIVDGVIASEFIVSITCIYIPALKETQSNSILFFFFGLSKH